MMSEITCERAKMILAFSIERYEYTPKLRLCCDHSTFPCHKMQAHV